MLTIFASLVASSVLTSSALAGTTGTEDHGVRTESQSSERVQDARHDDNRGHTASSAYSHGHRRPPPPPARRRPAPPVVVYRHAPAPAPVHHAAPEPDLHSVSLTVSAVHLAVPMAAVNAEFRLGKIGGLGLTGGFGSNNGDTLYELGAEIRGYAIGDFDSGLFIACGGRATDVPFYTPSENAVAAYGAVGAKYTFAVPITIEGEIGPQIVSTRDWNAVGPMVKVNVGFSF